MRFDPEADADRLIDAARSKDVPIRLVDVENEDACKLYGSMLVLVRPDGHVAWRGDEQPADVAYVIDVVRGARAFSQASPLTRLQEV